ncbi:MAG: immunoglobulin domain-containing protein, partial [Verrucomicrobiota bacterium]
GQTTIPTGLTNVVAIAAGYYYSMALENNGTVVVWGDNSYGQGAVPTGLNNVVSIAAGGYHALALVGNNSLTIVTQPASQSAYKGANVNLSAIVLGIPALSYQWQFNDANLPGATNGTLALANVQTNNAGDYRVVVSNAQGMATSSNAVLSIIVAPPNDMFANRISISGMTNTVLGSNILATKEPGEPNHDGLPGGASVWWTWTAPVNGSVTIDTFGSSFDTVLAVYTGTVVSNLTWIASDDDYGGLLTSLVDFNAIAGTAYQIAVDGYGDAMGSIVLNLGYLTFNSPVITGEPVSQTVINGNMAAFNLTASGQSPLAYQWYFNTNIPVAGATNATLLFANATTNETGFYLAVVTNIFGSATSSVANLTVAVMPNIYGITRNGNDGVTLSLADAPNGTNRIWFTTNLAAPIVWSVLTTNLAGGDGLWQLTDTNISANMMRFYRLSTP